MSNNQSTKAVSSLTTYTMIRSSTRITRISRQAFAGPQTTSYSSIATQNATLGDSLQSILSSFSEDATYAPTVNNKTTLNLLTSNDAIAVSYTHLDVYKRQVLKWTISTPLKKRMESAF